MATINQLNDPRGFAIDPFRYTGADAVSQPTNTTPLILNQGSEGRGNDTPAPGQGGLGFDRGSPLGGSTGDTGTLYGNVVSGLASYGNLAGGMLPGGFPAGIVAQALMPSATASVAKASQKALNDAIAKDPTFGGGGYSGVGGTTSATGAGIAANPMGIDPATAQGQASTSGGLSRGITASDKSGWAASVRDSFVKDAESDNDDKGGNDGGGGGGYGGEGNGTAGGYQ